MCTAQITNVAEKLQTISAVAGLAGAVLFITAGVIECVSEYRARKAEAERQPLALEQGQQAEQAN